MRIKRKFDPYKKIVTRKKVPREPHRQMRQGDEMACSCGARWSFGEEHPAP